MKISRVSQSHVQRLTGLRAYNKVRDLSKPSYNGTTLKEPKLVGWEEAVSTVKSGDWVFAHHCASTPVDAINELSVFAQKNNVKDVKVTSALSLGNLPYNKDPKSLDHIRPVTWFVGPETRKAVAAGKADYMPLFLNESSRIFDDKRVPVDAAFLSLSPPDENGICTLGVNCDFSSAASRNAKIIVATINPSQPRTFGNVEIHLSNIDYLTPNAVSPIVRVPQPKIKAEEDAIGTFIAEQLVDDEATLQLGIGSIPDAVLSKLGNHKNLGIHTEMISDGVIPLFEKGVVNNSKKTVDPGKSVLCFAMGSDKFYKFLDGNTDFLFGSTGYTNDVHTIALNHRMTGINSAIEIDLTGQAVSDTIGTSIFSGFGGQVDFVYGTGNAYDGQGKSILAITSRTEKGHSKIVPFIKQGAGVVSTRAHVRYVVTEYGIADLWGRSLLHRAHELIRISHPEDREALEKAAFERYGIMPKKD